MTSQISSWSCWQLQFGGASVRSGAVDCASWTRSNSTLPSVKQKALRPAPIAALVDMATRLHLIKQGRLAPSHGVRLHPIRLQPARATTSSQPRTTAAHTPSQHQEVGWSTQAASTGAALLAVGMLGAAAAYPEAAHAIELQAEPANALSLPTWAIHVSSVVEWVTGMGLFWKYAKVTGNPLWKGMTWGMLPSLGSAMCACTWHFFYNAPSLEFLVALQAFLTVVGNCTCLIAAYRLYDASQKQRAT